ncbi:MAG: PAS domain S-box protein [Desulfobacterales bacterium]|nr:PAS domain S-box protein [Desulfobacterales bacterium]
MFLTAIGYFSTRLLSEENQRSAHEHGVELLAKQIDLILGHRLRVLQALAKDHLVIDVLRKNVDPEGPRIRLLLNTANAISHTELIYIIDRDGTTVSSTDIADVSIVGFNYAFRPYFQKAIAGDVTVFPALGVLTKKRGLHLSAPVYDGPGEMPIGVIVLKIGISEVEYLIKEKDDKIAVVSPDGVIFSSNQPYWMFRATRPISAQTLERLKKNRQFGGAKIKPLGINLYDHNRVSVDRQSHYIAQVPLHIAGWEIVSCQKTEPPMPLPPFHRYLLGTVLCVTGGLATLIFFLAANIHRRRRTEVMLCCAEDKYHSIFKNAVMGVFQSTMDGRFLEASPSQAGILGFDTPEQLILSVKDIGKEIYVNPGDREEFIRRLGRDQQVKRFETQFYRKDGSVIWVLLSGRMVSGIFDDEPFLEGFCVDITEKKLAEESLRRERDIFSRLMETSPVGITLMNTQGIVTYANQRAEQILGLIKGDGNPAGYREPAWLMADFDGNPLAEDKFPAALVLSSGKTLQDSRYAIQWPDGRQVLLSLTIAPIFDASGNIAEMVSVFEDITEKVWAQEEEELRREQLFQADRMISMGILTSGVAHEINNPNTLILSNTQLLSDAWKAAKTILDEYYSENGDFLIGGIDYSRFAEKLPTICARIHDGSRRIKRIVKELRDYSCRESGSVNNAVNVNQVIRSAEILLASMIKESTHRFVLDIDEEVPDIRGNFQRLEQVIINVLQNACQALPDPDRGITISTSFDSVLDQVVITCRDEGVGIPKQDLGHVMDPFFTTKRESGGTGLGLSIASTIVHELRGVMEFNSQPDEGTTVILRFPNEKCE